MAVENLGLPYRGMRPKWCPVCKNNGVLYVESIDDEFDLVQCAVALRQPGECNAKPFPSDARVNVKREDVLFGY